MEIWLRNSFFVCRGCEIGRTRPSCRNYRSKRKCEFILSRLKRSILWRGSNRGPLGQRKFTKRTLYHRASRPRLPQPFYLHIYKFPLQQKWSSSVDCPKTECWVWFQLVNRTSEIQTVWEWDNFGNPNVQISDIYCIYNGLG